MARRRTTRRKASTKRRVYRRHRVGAKVTRRRRRPRRVGAFMGLKFDKKNIFAIILAYLIVSYIPGILSKYFNLSGLSETTVDLLGAGSGVALGRVMKNSNLETASIAIALASVVSGYVGPAIASATSSSPSAPSPSAHSPSSPPPLQTNAFLRLPQSRMGDYTNRAYMANPAEYENMYLN